MERELGKPQRAVTPQRRGDQDGRAWGERVGGSILGLGAVTDRLGKVARVSSSQHWPSEVFPVS